MSCPTCDSTMQKLDEVDGRKRFWCSRCGTLKSIDVGGFEEAGVPAIVQRARRYQKNIILEGLSTLRAVRMWFTMGLPESIDVPSDRPPS